MAAQIELEAAGLIEDFFMVNAEEITAGAAFEEAVLLEPFCITGPSVFEFQLAVSATLVDGEFTVELLIDDLVVATATEDDRQSDSSLSLAYRGSIAEESEVKVIATNGDLSNEVVLQPLSLQLGYKLWGPEYNLIEEPGESCLAL